MPTPFAPAIETWLAAFPSPNTRDAYRRCLVQLAQVLDGVPIESASSDDITRAAERWRRLRPHHSARTWNQWIACIRSCFNSLAAAGLIDRSPAQHLHALPEPVITRPTPTLEQIASIWALLNSPEIFEAAGPDKRPRIIRDRALFALMLSVRLRVEELINLRVRSFDFSTQLIETVTSRNSLKRVAWPAKITAILHDHLSDVKADSWAFRNLKGDKLSASALNYALKMLCDGINCGQLTAIQIRQAAPFQF